MDNWTNNPLRGRVSTRIIEMKSLATVVARFLRAYKYVKGSLPKMEMTKVC